MPTVDEVLRDRVSLDVSCVDRVSLDVSCVDRVYLNGYPPGTDGPVDSDVRHGAASLGRST